MTIKRSIIISGLLLTVLVNQASAIRPDHEARILALTSKLNARYLSKARHTVIPLTDAECEAVLSVIEQHKLSPDQVASAIDQAEQELVRIEQHSTPEQSLRGLDPAELKTRVLEQVLTNLRDAKNKGSYKSKRHHKDSMSKKSHHKKEHCSKNKQNSKHKHHGKHHNKCAHHTK